VKNILLIFVNSVRRGMLMLFVAVMAAVFMAVIFEALVSSGGEGSKGDKDADMIVISDKIKTGLIDRDNSPLSGNLKNYLENTLGMEVVLENDYELQAKLLIDRDISAIIEVPQGFYDDAARGSVRELVITTLDDYENASFIEVYLNSYMQSVRLYADAAGGNAEMFSRMLSADVSVGQVRVYENKDRGVNTLSAFVFAEGFMLMSIMGVTLFVSNSIITDRQQGTYSRIVCSPIRPGEYIVGTALCGIICGTIINVVFTVYAYSAHRDISVPQGIVLGACELFVLFSVGLSVMLALLIHSKQTLFTVGIGYTTFGCMLGGAWFPIADGLGAVGNVAKIFPQHWFMSMLRDGGSSGYGYFSRLCILALFALLVYLISAVIFSKKNN